MGKLKLLGGVVLVVALVVALLATIGPLPGFIIGGNPADKPATWPDTSGVHEVLLEVDAGLLPRVVIIWVIEYDEALHVVGADDSGWTQGIGQGGEVRLRLEDATYTLQATRITDNVEPIFAAYVAKYQPDYPDIVASFPSPADAATGTAVFRLE